MSRLAGATVRGLATAAVVVAVVGMLAACASEPRTTFLTPGGPAGSLTDATEAQVITALSTVGLQAAEANVPYRPPEGALLANAPRTVLQATLPEDPNHGFIVIYAFDSNQAADAAAREQAQYIASNRGGAFPRTSRFSLRIVGSNVVFSWWVPENVIDQREPLIEQGLLGVGSEVPMAR